MTLFLLSIWCVGREFIDIIDSIRRLSLSIHWRFQGLQWLCFRRRFMDHPWHSVFDNSMSMLWLHFCNRFDASFVNSLTLSILYVHCHSIFINDFKFNMDSVFADDLWISSHIAFFYNSMSLPWLYFFLSIWCVIREFIDDVDSIRRLSLCIHWQFQGLQWLCFRRQFMDQPWHSIFENFMCQP